MLRSTICLYIQLFACAYTIAQIQLNNDEFDDSRSIENWQNIRDFEGWGIDQLEYYNINDSLPGHFRVVPYTTSWFEEYRGPHLFKEITGNFIFTTRVSSLNQALDGPPGSLFSLAGIMVRSPNHYPNGAGGAGGWQPGQQNYIFLSLGLANNGDGRCDPSPVPCLAPHLEVKTTENSVSILDIEDVDTTVTQFRFARIDSSMIVMYQLATDTAWTIHRRYNRPDFPDTLHVGFTTYTDWTKVDAVGVDFQNNHTLSDTISNDPAPGTPFDPDLVADFDFARFDSVSVPDTLQGVDLVNTASSALLLEFLGFESEPFCPDSLVIIDPLQSSLFLAGAIDISTSTSVSDSAVVELTYANSAQLLPGFEMDSGSTMTIEQASCPN